MSKFHFSLLSFGYLILGRLATVVNPPITPAVDLEHVRREARREAAIGAGGRTSDELSKLKPVRRDVSRHFSRSQEAMPQYGEGNVLKPCDGDCLRAAKGGILFIGDSPIRRLFVRMFARLEGIEDSIWLHGLAQCEINAARRFDTQTGKASILDTQAYEASMLDTQTGKATMEASCEKELAHFTHAGTSFFSNGSTPFFNYEKKGVRLRYEIDEEFDPEKIGKFLKRAAPEEFQYVFVGFPLAHMLYHPAWGKANLACYFGRDFSSEIANRFQRVVSQLGQSSSKRIVAFSGGVPYAKEREFECTNKDCKPGSCDFTQDNQHVASVNKMHNDTFAKLATPSMRSVDIYGVTVRACNIMNCDKAVTGLSDNGVHYLYPILDEQLDAIVNAFAT